MLNWWDSLQNFIYVVMGAIVGAFVLLIRKVLTNDTEIKMLKAEIRQRNEYLEEADMKRTKHREEKDAEIHAQLAEIRSDIKRLIRQDTSEYRNNN